MKPIAILMILLLFLAFFFGPAWAGEEFTVDSSQIADLTPTTIKSISFDTGGDEYSTLTWEGGVFKFSGNPDKSAQVFLDWVQQYYDNRKELYCNVARVLPGEPGKIFKWVDEKQDAEIISVLERAYAIVQYTAIKDCEYKRIDCPETNKLLKDIDAMLKRLK